MLCNKYVINVWILNGTKALSTDCKGILSQDPPPKILSFWYKH